MTDKPDLPDKIFGVDPKKAYKKVLKSKQAKPKKKREVLENKIREHRIVVHNIDPTEDVIYEMAEEELGRVKIVGWREENIVHYQGAVPCNGIFVNMPQRDVYILVKYREYKTD